MSNSKPQKIPFGLVKATGEMVDVSEVAKGEACGCICPSCKATLIARKGNIKDWHFAHKKSSDSGTPESRCDYSFFFSVRMMMQQILRENLLFHTPDYPMWLLQLRTPHRIESKNEFVTTATPVLFDEVRLSAKLGGDTVDVLGIKANYQLAIFISYEGRQMPVSLYHYQSDDTGLLEINLQYIGERFRDVPAGKFTEELRTYLAEDVTDKTWIYHPKQRVYQQPFNSNFSTDVHQATAISSVPISSPALANEQDEGELKNFVCNHCHTRWTGRNSLCLKCNSPLYVFAC